MDFDLQNLKRVMETNIKFAQNEASLNQIRTHLLSCDQTFYQELSTKTNIVEYSKRIFDHSVRFEAWSNKKLVGLVAAYFNDTVSQFGYITNVSVSSGYNGKGIASQLLATCINYGKQHNFKQIGLEVSKNNLGGLRLYEKHSFSFANETDTNFKMKLDLS